MQRGRAARYTVAVALVCSVAAQAVEQEQATETADEQAAQPAPRKDDQATTKTAKATELEELVVEAKKPLSSASSDEVREKDYAVRPHDTMPALSPLRPEQTDFEQKARTLRPGERSR